MDDEDITNLIILVTIWIIVSVLVGSGLLVINAPVITIVLAVFALAIVMLYFHRRFSQ